MEGDPKRPKTGNFRLVLRVRAGLRANCSSWFCRRFAISFNETFFIFLLDSTREEHLIDVCLVCSGAQADAFMPDLLSRELFLSRARFFTPPAPRRAFYFRRELGYFYDITGGFFELISLGSRVDTHDDFFFLQ